ncbi:hypothetical protein NUACC26_004420 [Scytonema sp. NUACC26]
MSMMDKEYILSILVTVSDEIIEAQGWVKTPDGQIALVAQSSNATPSAATTSAQCPLTVTSDQ